MSGSAGLSDSGSYDVVVQHIHGTAPGVMPVNLSVGEVPDITMQLMPQSVCAGNLVVFMTAATGTPTPTFVWRRNGAIIPNENGATLTIASVAVGNAGSYTAQAVNACSSDTSGAATLTVTGKPTIVVAPPAFVQADKGGAVTLEVQATGATSYQWKLDGSILAGETQSVLTIDTALPPDAGVYTVVLGNNCDSVESEPTQLAIRHLSIAKFADGKFGFKMDGEANEIWIFQVSTDLKNWTETGRVTLDASGVPVSVSANPGMTYTTSLVILAGRVVDNGSDSMQTARMYRILKPQ
jgi:hypothetical protein